ncbi:hypothetical protein C8R45DRAFT_1178903, partial [Mycena sanguinolenta]
DKSVWLDLLDNLRRRSILDRTFNLEALSVAEMIGIVRRLVIGPQTWSPGELDCDPVAKISKTIMLHPQIAADVFLVKLLPSGFYVLFQNQYALECWHVAHDRRVWRHTPAVEHTWLMDFGAEEKDTDLTIIMICTCSDLPYSAMYFLEVVNVDLRTELILASWTLVPPTTFIDRLSVEYLLLCHDSHSQLALIPRDLIVLTHSVNGESLIHLISNDAIGASFLPIVPLDDRVGFSSVLVEEIPKLSTFHAINTVQPFQDMRIHASPIRDADFPVWISGRNYAANMNSVLPYQLSIPISGEPQWRLRREAMVSESQLVSYSGHVLCYKVSRGRWTIFSPGSSAENLRLQLFRDPEFGELATYSGVIICPTVEKTIVIQYYRSCALSQCT